MFSQARIDTELSLIDPVMYILVKQLALSSNHQTDVHS